MPQKDMGIEYHAKLKEVLANIQKLEDLNLDMARFKRSVRSIEKELNRKVKGSYQSFDTGSATAFLYDSLVGDYGQSIKKLDAINEALKREWETYFKISSHSKVISRDILGADENSISEIARSTLKMVKDMKCSTTIYFNVEKDIVYQVYGIVYKVMQLEFTYSNDSILFDAISHDLVDTSYIVELMKEEISHIDGDEKDEIISQIMKLEKEGIDDKHLLNKNLIILLALYNSSDLTLKKKEQFLERLDELTSLRIQIGNEECQRDCVKREIDELKSSKKEYTKKGIRKRIAILLNTILVSCGIVAGAVALGEVTQGEEYRTITTTYNSSTGEVQVDESFEAGKEGSLEMVEYSPWDAPGYFRDKYTRNCYTYNMNSISEEREDISSYLDRDLKDIISYSSSEEESEFLPEDYGYAENKYVITKVEKDLDTSQKVRRPLLWALSSLGTSLGLIAADFFLFKKLSKESLKVVKEGKKSAKEGLMHKLQEASDNEKSLQDLVDRKEREYALTQEEYETLPSVIKSSPDVSTAVKKYLKK